MPLRRVKATSRRTISIYQSNFSLLMLVFRIIKLRSKIVGICKRKDERGWYDCACNTTQKWVVFMFRSGQATARRVVENQCNIGRKGKEEVKSGRVHYQFGAFLQMVRCILFSFKLKEIVFNQDFLSTMHPTAIDLEIVTIEKNSIS